MSILFIDKDLEDMTIEELRRERRIHQWLASTYESMQWAMFKKYEFKRPVKDGVTKESITEKYINGQISDEEYNKWMRIAPMFEAKKEFHIQARQDKLDYLSIVGFEERAVVAMIDDRIEELGYKRPKKSGRKGKRKYTSHGYDPRKWISKHNHIRPKYTEYADVDKLHRTE